MLCLLLDHCAWATTARTRLCLLLPLHARRRRAAAQQRAFSAARGTNTWVKPACACRACLRPWVPALPAFVRYNYHSALYHCTTCTIHSFWVPLLPFWPHLRNHTHLTAWDLPLPLQDYLPASAPPALGPPAPFSRWVSSASFWEGCLTPVCTCHSWGAAVPLWVPCTPPHSHHRFLGGFSLPPVHFSAASSCGSATATCTSCFLSFDALPACTWVPASLCLPPACHYLPASILPAHLCCFSPHHLPVLGLPAAYHSTVTTLTSGNTWVLLLPPAPPHGLWSA